MRKSFPMLLICRKTEVASRLSRMQKEKYWRRTGRGNAGFFRFLSLKMLWPTAGILLLFNFPDSIYGFILLRLAYLREAAGEAAASAGVSVQAVVEEASVADGHVLKADVKFSGDAGPQVGAATHELHRGRKRNAAFYHVWGFLRAQLCFISSLTPAATTYNIDECRQKNNDDGEDAHQGAVHPGLHDPFGNGLQRNWENLGRKEERKIWVTEWMVLINSFLIPSKSAFIYATQSTCEW